MFVVNEDLSVSLNRGDAGIIKIPRVVSGKYEVNAGDILKLRIFRKKNCDGVLLVKEYLISEATEHIELALTGSDTKIGDIINKPTTFWYEIEQNPDTNPQTIVGYDENGPKIFMLYPEGNDSGELPSIGTGKKVNVADEAVTSIIENEIFQEYFKDKTNYITETVATAVENAKQTTETAAEEAKKIAESASETLIRAINGITGAEGVVWELGTILSTDGANGNSNTRIRISNDTKIPFNKNLRLSVLSDNVEIYVHFYDANGNKVSNVGWIKTLDFSTVEGNPNNLRIAARYITPENPTGEKIAELDESTIYIPYADIYSKIQIYNTDSLKSEVKKLSDDIENKIEKNYVDEKFDKLNKHLNGEPVEVTGIDWQQHNISNGANVNHTGRARTIGYNEIQNGMIIECTDGRTAMVHLYSAENVAGYVKSVGYKSNISLDDYVTDETKYFRISAQYGGAVIEKTDAENYETYVKVYAPAGGLVAEVEDLKNKKIDLETEMLDDSKNAVENGVIKKYVDDSIYEISGGVVNGLCPIGVNWEENGIGSGTGDNLSSNIRIRTANYLDCDASVVITATEGREIVIYFYSTGDVSGYLGVETKTDWLTGTINLTDYMPDGAKYFRLIGRYGSTNTWDNSTIVSDYITVKKYNEDYKVTLKELKETTDELTSDVEKIKNGIPFGDVIEDEPQTQGILNALLRAKHLANVKYTPLLDLPCQVGDRPAGTEITGIIYSSTREVDKMVGLNVSLHTFMTAIANSKSKIYTERLTTRNAKTYYGTVCSAFVCYAFGIPYTFTTYHMTVWDGFNEVGLYDLQLGDFMVTTKPAGHTILITGIKRDKYKRIVEITTTEAMTPTVTTITYIFDEFVNKYVKDVDNKGYNYRFFRYPMIGKTKYVPTEYVPLLDETPTEIIYPDIITNYGDKATVLTGTDITANVINADGYNSIEVYKDDTLFSTHNVEDVTISSAEAGHYEFRMVGTDKTSSTFIIVTDCSASKNSNTISFSSSNSEPLCVSIVNADHGNDYILPLETTDTSIDIDLADYPPLRQDQPIIYMKVYFKNEYGSVAVRVEI